MERRSRTEMENSFPDIFAPTHLPRSLSMQSFERYLIEDPVEEPRWNFHFEDQDVLKGIESAFLPPSEKQPLKKRRASLLPSLDVTVPLFGQEELKFESAADLCLGEELKRKGNWSTEEDALLMLHASEGLKLNKNWTEIALQIPGRTAKQCRERWCFNLDPKISQDHWTFSEDMLILAQQHKIGNRWALITSLLPGRTENGVKTRYKSLVRAREREWKPEEDTRIIDLYKEFGTQWEEVASRLDTDRTKHAVKKRIKELSQGLDSLPEPEIGSAKATMREVLYPKATLAEVSATYKNQIGSLAFKKSRRGSCISKAKSTYSKSSAGGYFKGDANDDYFRSTLDL